MRSSAGNEERRRLFVVFIVVAMPLLLCAYFVVQPYIDFTRVFGTAASEPIPGDDPETLYEMAQQAEHNGDLAYAADIARRMTLADPQDVIGRKYLARLALKTRDYPEAERRCREVLMRAPDDLGAQMGLAAALRGQNRPNDARTIYQAIIDNKKLSDMERGVAQNALDSLNGKPAGRSIAIPLSSLPTPQKGLHLPRLLR